MATARSTAPGTHDSWLDHDPAAMPYTAEQARAQKDPLAVKRRKAAHPEEGPLGHLDFDLPPADPDVSGRV